MDRKKPDAQKFPMVDDELLDAMRQETLMFVGAVMHENRSILDFIDGRFTFLNGPLARYYGIKGVDGEPFQRVELDGEQRSGIVTQALHPDHLVVRDAHVAGAAGQMGARQSAGRRAASAAGRHSAAGGDRSRHDGVDAAAAGAASREPGCARRATTRWTRSDSASRTTTRPALADKGRHFDIDTMGTLSDGRTFTGAAGLKRMLRAQAGCFAQNFTEKLMTYALGRGLERSDRPGGRAVSHRLARDNYRFGRS